MPSKFIVNTTDHRIVRDKKGFPMLRFGLTFGLVPQGAKDEDCMIASITGCIGSYGGGEEFQWHGPMIFMGRSFKGLLTTTPALIKMVLNSLEKSGSRGILLDRVNEWRESNKKDVKPPPEVLTLDNTYEEALV